jgi:hypothetical protein
MRRTRARQRRGLISVRLDVDEHRIAAALVAHGKLTEDEALRPGLVARELERLIDDYATRWLGPARDA